MATSLLKNMNTAAESEVQEEKNSLGGSFVWPSGAHDAEIVMAYVNESGTGAISVNFTFKSAAGTLRNTQYITSGRDKGLKNYYEDKDGAKHYLPGYNIVNAICLLTIGKQIDEIDTQTKQIMIYNADAKAEVPTPAEVITDLIGQKITLGVIETLEDVRKKAPDNSYYATGDTRPGNELDKVFRFDDKLTVVEIRAGESEAKFYTQWSESKTGSVKDKTDKKGNAGKAGAPARAAPGASAPKGKLFGPK